MDTRRWDEFLFVEFVFLVLCFVLVGDRRPLWLESTHTGEVYLTEPLEW